MQALIIQPQQAAAALLGSRTSRLRVKNEREAASSADKNRHEPKKNKHLSWARCLKRFKCFFFLLLLLYFCPSFSCGHHQGPVPEREVQPPQGVRRQGLPEGHVCQSQETGAKVGGPIPLRAEGFFRSVGRRSRPLLCQHSMVSRLRVRLKSFRRAVVKLSIGLCSTRGERHRPGSVPFEPEHPDSAATS